MVRALRLEGDWEGTWGGGGRSTDGGRSMWTSTKAREDAFICTYPGPRSGEFMRF